MNKQSLAIALLSSLTFSSCMSALWDGLPSGRVAPELDSKDWINAETTVQLEQLRGKPVLLEFWSQDCPPCRKHVPVMKRIQAGYAERGLQVVSVHVSLEKGAPEQDVEAVRQYVAEQGIEYPVGVDQAGKDWDRYSFGYLPHAVLIDSAGQVTWSRNLVVGDAEKAVRKLLGAPADTSRTLVLAEDTAAGPDECAGGVCSVK